MTEYDDYQPSKAPVGGKDHYNGGRIPTRFYYTYQDIADITNLSLRTIRLHVREGILDPSTLPTLLKYIQEKTK